MQQFDLFRNPVAAARRAYPYVICVQSPLATSGTEAVVAPLVPRHALAGVAGRLAPVVSLDGDDYAVVVHQLSTLILSDLTTRIATLAQYRAQLLAAIDLLFFGI